MSYNNYNKRRTSENKKEFTSEDLIKDYQSMKLFTILYFNDFCFEWQLIKKFNLSKSQVQKTSENLDKLGFLSFRLLSELSETMQEAILKITPNFDKIYKENPKVYVITPNGKKEGKDLISKTLKASLGNQGFYDFLQEVNRWSESFRVTKRKIKVEEESSLYRLITFPNGVTMEKPTKKFLNLLTEINLALRVSGRNKDKLLVQNDKNSFLAIQEEVRRQLRRQLNTNQEYTGIYSYLTQSDIIELTREVSAKEGQDLERETKREAKEIRGKKDLTWEVMRSRKVDPLLMEEDFNKGLSFLDGLEVKGE